MQIQLRNEFVITGVAGLMAASLVGIVEYLLHYDALARFTAGGYAFMGEIPENRSSLGHFLGVFGATMYPIGCYHIYLMLRPANRRWAFNAFLIGTFVFIDSAEQAPLADFEFSWGAVFEDFNLDGRDDLVVSENYEGWPLHKMPAWRLNGRFLLQSLNGQFVEAGPEAGIRIREFGITPLTADFNQDGYPDLIHVNLLGEQNVFLSRGGNQGYLKVRLPNTVDSTGAEVTILLGDGSTLVRHFVLGEGLVSDQSHVLIFGLGDQKATKIFVESLSGDVSCHPCPVSDGSLQTRLQGTQRFCQRDLLVCSCHYPIGNFDVEIATR